MKDTLEKFALDVMKFNKYDERKENNKERDKFMIMSFKIFISVLILTIVYLVICKCFRKVKVKQ